MDNKQVRIFKNVFGEIWWLYPQGKWVKKTQNQNVIRYEEYNILVFGNYCSYIKCVLECLEKLGVWIGRESINGVDKWLVEYCNRVQPFPNLEPSFIIKGKEENKKCGGCDNNGGNMDLAAWFRLQHHLTRGQKLVGCGFPSLCAWGEELEKVEKINNTKFKIINVDRSLEECINDAIIKTKQNPEWGGFHMAQIPEIDRCCQIEILQRHLYKKKNEFLKNRESFQIQGEQLLEEPSFVINEIVCWLRDNFNYTPTEEQIQNAMKMKFVQEK